MVTRSHSPPLPPNATYNHPIISLNILPSAKVFTAGSKVSGMLEVICKERNSVALGQLAIEFFGIEELKLLDHSAQSSIHGPHKCIFQGPALPPSNAVATSEAPIGGHYYTALRGRTKFPFSFPLPSKLPSSTNFNDKARVCYALKATCQVLSIESRQNVLVTKSKTIQIVEKLLDWNDTKFHEPVEMRGELRDPTGTGAGVWAEVKIDKMLHFNLNSSQSDDGLIRAQLTVKNNSRRTLSGGVNAKICRKLVLPQDTTSSTDPSRIQVVRNCTFRGIDYEFPSASGQAKTVKLVCQLPSPTEDDINHADHNSACISVRGVKLFSVDMFLRVELELGALSNDLIVDLPLYVTHVSSLPKELLICNAPMTIEHVPSTNAMSITHLTKPDSSSGRVSRNTSRSSSPHPPSLQPGNISRSASPRLSLSIGGDWGGIHNRSAPPSPSGSAHFSPLPTPQPSPRPSSRFSSPMPFSPSSAVPPNHHPPVSGVAPAVNYFPNSAAWSNPSSASYPVDHAMDSNQPAPFHPLSTSHGFSPYPPHCVTPAPTHDPRSHVGPSNSQYPPPQSIFSPPTTPWHRQTVPTSSHFDPTSTSQPDHPYQAINGMPPLAPQNHPVPIQYQQEPFSPSAHQGYDVGSPMPPNWRTRHQSLPAAPVPPTHHYRPPDSHYDSESVSDHSSALSRKSSNSRRTSEPINHNITAQQPPSSGGIIVRKRALPTPPQASHTVGPVSHGSAHPESHLNNVPDHQTSVPNDMANALQQSRLETIGEVGESRPGTLSAKLLSQNTLNLLARGESADEDDGNTRHPRRQQAVRVVSQPRGTRPRRSDGSDSVQALEDIVALEDERRSADGARARDPSPDQTPTLNNQKAVFQAPSHSDQEPDHRSGPRQTSPGQSPRERSSSSPHLASSTRATPTTGLANLAHFLNRTTSVEPPRASSAHEGTSSNAGSASVDREHDSLSVHSTEDKLTRTATPSYTGSALRMKSSRISYGETMINAIPSPPSAPKAPVELDCSTTTRQDTTDWRPPSALANSSSRPPRASIAEQMNLCDDQQTDEPTLARESVAPEALFPQFEAEQFSSVSVPAVPPPSLPAKTVTTTIIPVDCSSPSAPSVPQNPTTSPLIIPSDSPTVKRKGLNTQRKSSQPRKPPSDIESHSSPSRIDLKPVSASPNLPIIINKDVLAQPQQKTIVERLRSQNAPPVIQQQPVSQSRPAFKECSPSRKDASAMITHEAPRQSAAAISLGLATKQTDRPKDVVQMRPTLPKPPVESTVVNQSNHHIFQPSSSLDKSDFTTAPLVHRLSAIPKSSTPLSLAGASLYQSSPNSTPHRPLPISPSCAHEAKMASMNPTPVVGLLESVSAKDNYDAHVGTRALFSSQQTPQPAPVMMTSEKPLSRIESPSRLNTDSLGAPCSPTSPTNLSRKSRIKRQMSSTHTIHDSVSLSKVGGSRIGGEDGMFSISRVPGGWNEEESNEIEAQLIEALRETNLAVQKATSRRLSTPEFVKSPAKSRSSIRSSMYSTSQAGVPSTNRSSLIGFDRLRASISIAERTSEDSDGTIDRSRDPDSRGSLDWPSRSQTDDSVKSMSFDEDTPIPLTNGEYKSMRGGRGGRVSSVVGQWAKLTGADGQGILSGRKEGEVGEKEEDLSASKLLISTRGLSIRPKNISRPPSQYSIGGLLSRNSSLSSQLSSSRPPEARAFGLQDSNRRSKASSPQKELSSAKPPIDQLPSSAPSFKTPPGLVAARVLPPIPGSGAEEPQSTTVAGPTKLGYRNLANRLSGGVYPSGSHPSGPSSKSTSSSSNSSISSLGSVSTNNNLILPSSLSSADENSRLNKNFRNSLLSRPDRRKLNAIHTLANPSTTPGPISDLVKRWESRFSTFKAVPDLGSTMA
ncbi:hypothetical protein PGTUg99_004291 [Puccinia graminis f. sp. tritici]|uniref:Arrestin C-terminal-like domain-containing protein n=1 Tax=Puccinia graminis f. sp. tritici TaxID=56615 RepID=A0A5B0M452_PUCGR|nr:hypothetical protein PGTUg99_004291 [Puccinia graminis f. sp. tritici]